MIGGDIQYKIGNNQTIEYKCLCCDEQEGVIECPYDENASLQPSYIINRDVYETFTAGGVLSRTVGYWLAVLSVVGLIGIFVSLRSEGFMQRK